MQQYFDNHYQGPAFDLYGPGHLLALGVVAAIIGFLIWGWRNPEEASKQRARYAIFAIFLLFELLWHGWNVAHGTWSIRINLPLHLCSLAIWCAMYLVLTRSYRVYEILYFVGIAGASQALLTPDAGPYGLPHFRAIQTLVSHGMLLIVMVYMTTIEGFRPTWGSVWRTMLVLNVYVLPVAGVNVLLDSNYMFLMRKPASASLFDFMGPWPWYVLVAEGVALLLFSMLYLPFAWRDWRDRRLQRETAG